MFILHADEAIAAGWIPMAAEVASEGPNLVAVVVLIACVVVFLIALFALAVRQLRAHHAERHPADDLPATARPFLNDRRF